MMTRHSKRYFLILLFVSSWVLFALFYLIISLFNAVLSRPGRIPSAIDKLMITTGAFAVALVVFLAIASRLRRAIFLRKSSLSTSVPLPRLSSHSMAFLQRMQQIGLVQLQVDASEAVGRIMEAYSASRASLYLHDDKRNQLELFVALNHPKSPWILRLEQNSITTLVARRISGYCSDDVKNDPHYLQSDPKTKSEIAVPISFKNQLIGVLNLEAVHQTNNFLAEQIVDLEKRSLSLAPMLLLKKSFDPASIALPLSFRGSDWGLSSILGPLCMEACRYFEKQLNARPSCTVWEFEEEKNCFHARVPCEFDYEYRIDRTLPKKDSFTGEIFDKAPGFVFIDDFANIKNFLRRDKAMIAGTTKVVSSPLYLPQSQSRFGVVTFYHRIYNRAIQQDHS